MKRNWIRWTSEVMFLVLTIALTYLGRSTGLAIVIPAILFAGLEWNQWKIHNRVATLTGATLFVAYALWLFNDLMAIGKFSERPGISGLLNFLLYLVPFLFFMALFQKRILAYMIPEIFFVVVGVTNLIVKAIRRTPISAGDLYSVKTAMAVAGNYHMEFDKEFLMKAALGLIILILTFVILHEYFKTQDKKTKIALPTRIILGSLSIVWAIILLTTSLVVTVSGRKPDYFSHETNGFALNLYLQWKDISIKEPEGYHVEQLSDLEKEYPSDVADQIEDNLPNVIAIMNESFADLRVLGEYETNMEVLPFLDSLQENTIRGTMYSSVYGGNTANSEFEFLTGNSMEYFSERVVPYQLFMNEKRPSFISQMQDIGYETVFMHPYRSYSWNRPSVYTALGVDQMLYEEDMTELSYIRAYASDESQYEYVKKYLEGKGEKPLFLFDVTVQNHGGYTGSIEELEDKVSIVGHEGEFVETENYLTLAHESDRALGEFIKYLQTYPEPTVVVFYGDHQPAIESQFIEMAMNKRGEDFTLEDIQKKYQVPFFIWANYEIEEEEVEQISINYLSTLLCEKIGLPMTGMQKYLKDLYQQMPVINTVGVIDKDAQYRTRYDVLEDETTRLKEYNWLIYNYMFDDKNKKQNFYKLR